MSDTGEKGNLRKKVKEEVMEEVDTFRYLGVDFASNGRMDAELNHRSMEVRKCAGNNTILYLILRMKIQIK